MRRPPTVAPILVLVGLAGWAVACGDGATEPPPPPPPDPPRATAVTVTPATASMTARGDTVRLTAEVRDQNGNVMAGASVAWSSGDASVATVDGSGLVTAAGAGTAAITATSGSASGSATVTVAQQVSGVAVSPAADTLFVGDTLRLVAEAFDANGHAVAGAEFTWESGDASVATVDGSGLVTGVGLGEAEVTATSSGVSGRAALTVVAPVATTVAVTPNTVELPARDDTLRLVAEAFDANGHAVAGAEFTWTSSDASVATVDGSGLVTAAGNGAATITATSGSASGNATVTVAQQVSEVAVSPAADTLFVGDTLRLVAEAFDANGHAVAGAEFTWASSDASVATVDGSGLVTGTGAGEVEITATSSGVTGRTALAVVAPVATTVAVTPDTVELAARGDTVRLTAEAFDANGHAVAGAEFTWASSDASVATVDGSGLVTAAGNGAATITATSGSASGSATVTVVQQVSEVAVSPAADTLFVGDTLRLVAEAFDANGHAVAGAEFTWASSDASVATVDGAGLVTGTGAGEVKIAATTAGVAGVAQLAVVASVPTSVAVAPDKVVFAALGDTARLTAEVRDQIGRVMEGVTVSWSSSDTTAAEVDASGLVTAAGSGTATITAAAGSASGSATVTVAQAVSAVAVAPAAVTLVEGDTLRLTAEAFDANGHPVAGVEFTWESGDTAVAVVDDAGLVTGTGAGEVEIAAAALGVAGRVSLTVVAPVPTTVAVTPDTLAFAALGDTARLTAEVRDQIGRVMEGVTVSWSSSDTTAAEVDASGLVTAAGSGTATITAAAGSASGSATVTVAQAVSAVAVAPAAVTLVEGDTLRLTAEAFDANGHPVAGVEFTWESGDTAVAVVDDAGLVTGTGAGEVEIAAAALGVAGRVSLTVVAPVPTTVAVTPDTLAFAALGDTARLTAEVRDQNGRPMPDRAVAWVSGDTLVATVDSAGLVTAAGSGTATITAAAGSASGSATVTVAQAVSAVAVAPAAVTLVEGDTLRLTAEAFDANGHPVAGVEFTWESGDTAVAVVDDAGLVTGTGAGEVEIAAAALGVAGRVSLTVVAPVPTTVAVTPDTLAFAALGDTARLTAEVRDQNGRPMPDRAVAWVSGDTLVATVDSVGLVTAAGAGTATITAAAGSAADTAIVTVTPAVGVVVRPAADTIGRGDTLRLSAELYDENGHRVSAAAFSWSTSNESVASVDGAGLVRGVGEGGATITATAGEAFGISEITVEYHDRAALVALYEATDGPNWAKNDNWLTDAPLGDWYGVRTDGSGRVVSLDLAGEWDREKSEWIRHGLSGTIPPELANLVELEWLSLGANDLTGRIPSEFGDLVKLRGLVLGHNNLTGPIPVELVNLARLQGLNLCDNALEGPIPVELGSLVNLEWLYLCSNDLTGPIPSELADLAQLRVLGLNHGALEGPIPPELGSLVSLERLELYDNALEGPIPAELGNLVKLDWLQLAFNDLTGAIPQSFLQLDSLQTFHIRGNESLCVPGISAFVVWLEGIERRDESDAFCNESDRKVLDLLFERAGGSGWTNADGWVGGPALDEWYGVRADSLGRVAALDLERNGLSGRLPASLGTLARMTELRIGGNTALSGPLPQSLAALSLRTLHYEGTDVCAPSQAGFQEWLNAIPSHEGTGVACAPLSDREILEVAYETLGGPDWANSDNWLTDRPLGDWYGVEVDDQGRVTGLSLTYNRLSGVIPPELGSLQHLDQLNLGGSNSDLAGVIPAELGDLANLISLSLWGSDLEGAIPAELGRLRNLGWLDLSDNHLAGTVPSELGDLAELRGLFLGGNELTGPIPGELGSLSHLRALALARNRLAGSLPPELGRLARLRELHAGHNELQGAVPLEFRGLTSLLELSLSGNAEMSGALPAELTALNLLETLVADGTGLCAPSDADFLDWLDGLPNGRIPPCGSGPAMAYLVQTVQSREFPVPLVAGEEALLRTFVTASRANREPLPRVRASFHVGGALVHTAEIPSSAGPIPTEVEQGSLAASANAAIPAAAIRPGLEMVVEIDPDGTLDPGLGVARRIPETGRLPVDVREMPVLDLTLIPFLWSADPDSAILGQTASMAADPHGHELLSDTRTLLPVGAFEVTAHAPVLSSSNDMLDLLRETLLIRRLEAGGGHWMGMMSGPTSGPGGVAHLPGWISSSQPRAFIIAHELGHNMSLRHAPCGVSASPAFPYPDGSIGVWGYDFEGGGLVSPSTPDVMSYCGPRWISDYHFTGALRYRLADEGSAGDATVAEPAASLMLWGGVDADGAPFLEPAFAVDAPPLLPDSAGDHRIVGTGAGGETLFSISFAMPELADADEESSFVFVVPARPAWQAALAAVTLTGPGGTAALDGDGDRAMAILRDPRTGQVRAILRDLPPQYRTAADATAGVAEPGLEVMFSRGIPDAAAWRRAGERMR